MLKKSLMLIGFVFFLASVGAFASTTVTDYNELVAIVNISNTTNLYAYEINFDYSGAAPTIQQYNFLGSSSIATYGSNTKNNILSVYGSRLDSNRTGVNGSGRVFNVTHFGALTLRYTLAIFSNGTEVYRYYNTSVVAAQDGDTGGNGGSGGGGGSKITQFTITPNLLNLELLEGRTMREKVRLMNTAGRDLQVTEMDFGNLGEFVAFYAPEVPFYLPKNGYVDVSIDFFAPKGSLPDVYTGEIKFKTPDSYELLPTVLQVSQEKPLFDVIVSLDKDEFAPGETVVARIEIQNFGEKRDIDVLVHYAIKDFAGEELVFEEGSYAIENYKLQLVAKLRVPKDAAIDDKLIFYTQVSYPSETSASASSVFTVVEPLFGPITNAANLFLIILIPIAIVAIIIVTIVIVFNVTRAPAPQQVLQN